MNGECEQRLCQSGLCGECFTPLQRLWSRVVNMTEMDLDFYKQKQSNKNKINVSI